MAEDSESRKSEFEKAGEGEQDSLIREFIDFVFENKKWWLIPILLVLYLVGSLAVLVSTGAAPFIYTLF
ncbi:MAG: hypothetical protein M2R45_00128 [Verrucomicrobia subdivision 3 bacterium]|nr:hypothetical protein [Limisphaerales bacterium]MCS1412412.1 hypothetical protein [Limisphaerales bacterium]